MTEPKIKARYIILDRAEYSKHEDHGPHLFRTWSEAEHCLFMWGVRMKHDGYDKVDFVIIYRDGETYEGRYDLERAPGMGLTGHVRSFVEFSAGVTNSGWTQEQADIVRNRQPGFREKMAAFLQNYAIGDID